MNKAELVREVAAKTTASQKSIDEIIHAAMTVIMVSVAKGEKVTLVGFGTFEAKERAAREGRNPKTGEVIQIPATTVPKFAAGKNFKDLLA